MIRKVFNRLKDLRLRTKLTTVIVTTMLAILLVNVFMYFNLNKITKQMDEIYAGNIRLNELDDALDRLQGSMTGYLNTKSTDVADRYFILKDFRAYIDAQKRVEEAYRDEKRWAKSAILNVANSGKFSSDRTIEEYVKDIWKLKKVKVDL